MTRNEVYLRHNLDAIDRINGYVAGMAYDKFERDFMAQDAAIGQLSVIGEAARRVSSTLQGDRPEIPWADIIGMRNILIHDYLEVDLQEVWKTIQDDLPALRTQVVKVLQFE